MKPPIPRFCLTGALLAVAASALGAVPEDDIRVTPVVRAYRQAAPAVVNISTERIVRVGPRLFGLGDDVFEEVFGQRLVREVPAVSLGSGFLIHPDGYLVTNAHVVGRAEKITATLADGSSFRAEVVASNDDDDLAVLKIASEKPRAFDFLRLGRSDDLMIGETVIAIGNPLGYQNTCSTGVISAVDRKLEFRNDVEVGGLIQTDAPINPGSSGGPLLNIKGELIAINTAIRADAQGIGFAIPVDKLVEDFPRLLDFERLQRVIFGLKVRARHAKTGEEIVVESVLAGTPAAAAGARAEDRVVAINGRAVKQICDYQIAMLAARAGDKIALGCRRDGKPVELTVTIAARPKPDGAALAVGLFGLSFREITPEMARNQRLPVEQGLLVVEVEKGSPADVLGLRRGDIVFQIGRWYVTSMETVGSVLEDVPAGAGVRIGIIRGNVRAWATMKARQPPATRPTGAKTDI